MDYWSSSDGSLQLEISLEDAESGYHTGQCDDDIEGLRKLPHIRSQVFNWDEDDVREELINYGYDPNDLENSYDNESRLLWLACGSIVDGQE